MNATVTEAQAKYITDLTVKELVSLGGNASYFASSGTLHTDSVVQLAMRVAGIVAAPKDRTAIDYFTGKLVIASDPYDREDAHDAQKEILTGLVTEEMCNAIFTDISVPEPTLEKMRPSRGEAIAIGERVIAAVSNHFPEALDVSWWTFGGFPYEQ